MALTLCHISCCWLFVVCLGLGNFGLGLALSTVSIIEWALWQRLYLRFCARGADRRALAGAEEIAQNVQKEEEDAVAEKNKAIGVFGTDAAEDKLTLGDSLIENEDPRVTGPVGYLSSSVGRSPPRRKEDHPYPPLLLFADPREVLRFRSVLDHLAVAGPCMVAVCAEWFVWELLVPLVGMIGASALAVHVVATNIWTVLYNFPLGVAGSTAQLVGNCLGAGHGERAHKYSKFAVAYAWWTGLAIALIGLRFADDFVEFYLPSASVGGGGRGPPHSTVLSSTGTLSSSDSGRSFVETVMENRESRHDEHGAVAFLRARHGGIQPSSVSLAPLQPFLRTIGLIRDNGDDVPCKSLDWNPHVGGLGAGLRGIQLGERR